MMTLKVLAKAHDWEVVLDVNSVISIHHGNGIWICSHNSAYEAIKNEVKDPAIRAELLRQWALSMKGIQS